jgi:hypothetical protein
MLVEKIPSSNYADVSLSTPLIYLNENNNHIKYGVYTNAGQE